MLGGWGWNIFEFEFIQITSFVTFKSYNRSHKDAQCAKGWEKAGIIKIVNGKPNLPPDDTFVLS